MIIDIHIHGSDRVCQMRIQYEMSRTHCIGGKSILTHNHKVVITYMNLHRDT